LDNHKLKELLELLDEAEKFAAQFTGGYSEDFFSAEEFHAALAESIVKLKAGDVKQLAYLRRWFSPSYSWDDFIKKEGEAIANKIFGLLIDIQKSSDQG
jgi:hypothetical protein